MPSVEETIKLSKRNHAGRTDKAGVFRERTKLLVYGAN